MVRIILEIEDPIGHDGGSNSLHILSVFSTKRRPFQLISIHPDRVCHSLLELVLAQELHPPLFKVHIYLPFGTVHIEGEGQPLVNTPVPLLGQRQDPLDDVVALILRKSGSGSFGADDSEGTQHRRCPRSVIHFWRSGAGRSVWLAATWKQATSCSGSHVLKEPRVRRYVRDRAKVSGHF